MKEEPLSLYVSAYDDYGDYSSKNNTFGTLFGGLPKDFSIVCRLLLNHLFFFKLIFWRNFGNWAVTTAQPFCFRLWLLSDTYVCGGPFLASHADRIAPVFVPHIFSTLPQIDINHCL